MRGNIGQRYLISPIRSDGALASVLL